MIKALGLVTFAFLVVFNSLPSCTKTNTIIKTDTVTVTQTDTVTIKDTAITAAILTANSWKVQELRGVIGNSAVYYLRGGANNTQSLDNEYITFNSDHTGLYVADNGVSTTLTWHFTDAKTIAWTWNLPTAVNVTWENVFYKNKSIRYTESYVQFGQNEVTDGIRVPK